MRHREFRCGARSSHSNVPVGMILVVVGGALLARQLGAPLPSWLFSWEMLVITIGLMVGIANKFRDFGWLIMVGVGAFFLADDLYPSISHYIWPALIIIIGLIILLRPKRQGGTFVQANVAANATTTVDYPPVSEGTPLESDVLDVVAVFGGSKRVVLSKNFRGGEIVNVFGGSEINLSQADFKGPIKIEIVAIFGGCKLVVPANWEIRTETTAILGGIDDKRQLSAMHPDKIVVLHGTVILGGIEITSY